MPCTLLVQDPNGLVKILALVLSPLARTGVWCESDDDDGIGDVVVVECSGDEFCLVRAIRRSLSPPISLRKYGQLQGRKIQC